MKLEIRHLLSQNRRRGVSRAHFPNAVTPDRESAEPIVRNILWNMDLVCIPFQKYEKGEGGNIQQLKLWTVGL
jgi:hypothetical protein